ncbi:MAG: endopeptidase La [Eubacteriales bacterium]|nr:endopeptidase La [Eubacteriales bacterium]
MPEKTDLKKLEGQHLPVLPLSNVLLFPNSRLTFEVRSEVAKQAIIFSERADSEIIVVLQKDAFVEYPDVDDLREIGTIGKIDVVVDEDDGGLRVSCIGVERCKITEVQKEVLERRKMPNGEKPYFLEAKPELLPSIFDDSKAAESIREPLKKTMLRSFRKIAHAQGEMPREIAWLIERANSIEAMMDVIASLVDFDTKDRYDLLSTIDVDERLRKLVELLHQEMKVYEIGRDLAHNMDHKLEKKQRKMLIREQIRVLEEELGDGSRNELTEMLELLEKSSMPEAYKVKVRKEIDRLERMPEGFGEASILRNWLDLVLALPFGKTLPEKISVRQAKRVLDRDHYGLEKIKERILEFVAVRKQRMDRAVEEGEDPNSRLKGPILCLVGPPGVGKTSIARSVAEALGREYVRMSVGGVKDESEIRGHRRTYIGALPGRVIQAIRDAGCDNPLFLLDEIDKIGSRYHGDPTAALLEVLDPEQNNSFRDHYLEFEYDLSKVLFITTANDLSSIPRPLLDRLELIHLSGYTDVEKVEIALRYLLPKQIEAHGLKKDQLSITRGAMEKIISGYTEEAGVRQLERVMAKLCRKVAVKLGSEEGYTGSRILQKDVEDFLGGAKYFYEKIPRKSEIGQATGLAWTAVGGDTLSIEVNHYPGQGKLILTGRLGTVMQESAQAALTYVRSRYDKIGIDEEVFNRHDVHIHVPAGAVPKDGPSAGITIATALASALSGRAVKPGIAMTGELTLRGKVLPIGGLKEKSVAAKRAGIKEILIPQDNLREIEDEVPELIRKELIITPVKHMDEVLDLVLKAKEEREE